MDSIAFRASGVSNWAKTLICCDGASDLKSERMRDSNSNALNLLSSFFPFIAISPIERVIQSGEKSSVSLASSAWTSLVCIKFVLFTFAEASEAFGYTVL